MNKTNTQAIHSPLSKIQCLSGFSLKMIGVLFMVMDHIHQMFYMFGAPLWLTMAGRIVLPIFLFMASEGYHYTRNKKKYMLRLLFAFWLMNIGNLVISRLFPLEDVMLINGIFGTMFLSVFYMWVLDSLVDGIKLKNRKKVLLSIFGFTLPILAVLPLLFLSSLPFVFLQLYITFVPSVVTVEAGTVAIALAVGFHFLRKHRLLQILLLVLLSVPSFLAGDIQWMMAFAAIPILLYNEKPGVKSKNFFYIFYPAHIYILYLISYFIHP